MNGTTKGEKIVKVKLLTDGGYYRDMFKNAIGETFNAKVFGNVASVDLEDGKGYFWDYYDHEYEIVNEEKEDKLKEAIDLLEFAFHRLEEINVSNYNHNDVCSLNDASVEVILVIKNFLGL